MDFSEAIAKADARREGPRKRLPLWAQQFWPIAEAYCCGKQKVTLGELARLARDSKIPHLPRDDGNIRPILKKMHAQGLAIPGYHSGTRGEARSPEAGG